MNLDRYVEELDGGGFDYRYDDECDLDIDLNRIIIANNLSCINLNIEEGE